MKLIKSEDLIQVMAAENQFCITGINYILKQQFIIIFHNITAVFYSIL